jgi:starvation-inducible DNA-binding protein
MPSASHDLEQPTFATVDASQRNKNLEVLQPVLENLIAYGLTIKQLHWNVIGPNFRPIHLHLDEIHEIVEHGIDEVAERITACGFSPDGTLKHVAKEAKLKDAPQGFIRDTEVLQIATDRTKSLIDLTREQMAKIEEEDTVTADLLHQVVEQLEKHHWMLQAQRV